MDHLNADAAETIIRLRHERNALRSACKALLANIDSGETIISWARDENGHKAGEVGNLEAMRSALAASL